MRNPSVKSAKSFLKCWFDIQLRVLSLQPSWQLSPNNGIVLNVVLSPFSCTYEIKGVHTAFSSRCTIAKSNKLMTYQSSGFMILTDSVTKSFSSKWPSNLKTPMTFFYLQYFLKFNFKLTFLLTCCQTNNHLYYNLT